MRHTRAYWRGISAFVVAAPLTVWVGNSAPPMQNTNAAASSCTATLSGSQYPEMVPSYLTWETFFRDAVSPGASLLRSIGLTEGQANTTRTAGSAALARASAVRKGPQAAFDVATEFAASEAVLAARDELILQFPDALFQAIDSSATERSKQRVYTLAVPGRRRNVDGTVRCVVTITGREHAEMIPEAEMWRNHFEVYAHAATIALAGATQYPASHLQAIQQMQLPVPTAELTKFIDIARETTSSIERAQANGATPSEIAAVVLHGRSVLLRSVSHRTWLAILRDVARTREGIIYSFPPSI